MEVGEELLKFMPEGISLRSFKSPFGLEIRQDESGRREMKRRVRYCIGKWFGAGDWKVWRMVSRAEVVSFDVFDTLVKRNVKAPEDVHREVEKKFFEKTGVKLDNYQRHRVEAEREARREERGEETSLEEIFRHMRGIPEAYKGMLLRLEEETEVGICCPCRRVKRFYQMAKKKGKPILITSDMYLRETVIRKILKRCGYGGFERLYLSSSYGLCKSTGTIYDVIKKDYPLWKGKLLHIGDHVKSDFWMARKKGIKACLIDGQEINLKYWKRRKKGDFRYEKLFSFMNNHTGNPHSEAASIGYEILGPMLLGYCMWMKEKTKKDSIDKIFFLSREGKILQEAFGILYPECRIPQHYLSVSRQSLLVPLLADVSDFDGLIETIKCYFHVPVLKTIQTVCLLDEREFKAGLAQIGLGEDADIYGIPDSKKEAVFSLIKKLGKERFLQQKSYVEKYLKENGFTGNVAIADIGWAGTMQNALQKYRKGTDTVIHGYYFGVRNLENDRYYQGFHRKGYFFEPGRMEDYDLMTRFTQGILELLFLNKTGSVQAYGIRQEGDRQSIIPVLAEAEYGGKEGEFIDEVQRAALRFLRLARKDFILEKNLEMKAEDAMEVYANFAVYPNLSSLQVFEDFNFVDGNVRKVLPEHSIFYYLLHIGELKQEVNRSICKIFLLKKFFKVRFPYFQLLKWMVVKLDMKSEYRKKYFSQ